MQKEIDKYQEKIAKIVGVFKGGSSVEDDKITTGFTHNSNLKDKQLRKLMKIGKVNVKRSGAGIRITIVSQNFSG
jgi:hypothetical protein